MNAEDHEADALNAYVEAARSGSQIVNGGPTASPIPNDDPHLPSEEAGLADEMLNLARNIQADPTFESALESWLVQTARNRDQRGRAGFPIGRIFAWGGLAAALLFGLIWALGNLLPPGSLPVAPPRTETASSSLSTGQVTSLAPPATPTPTPLPYPTPTPSGEIFSLPIQPDVDFLLQAGFPESPSEVDLYRQISSSGLTVEMAKTAAAQLGVNGSVYLSPIGPPGANSYLVWDGRQRVVFFSSPRSFEYESGNPILYEEPDCQPPCLPTEAVGALAEFLAGRGLLDFPVEFRPSQTQAHVEHLVQTLDGIPLLYRPGEYQGEALMSSSGEVQRLDYNPASFETLGKFPILSARQAWQAATSIQRTQGLEITSHSALSADLRVWRRVYPLNSSVDLFGSVQVFQPASPETSPLVLFDGFPVTGSTQGMVEATADNPFLQVWGQFQEPEPGTRTLQVEGWQRSAFPSQVLAGTIQRAGERGYLSSDNQNFLLPDLPADVPEGQTLTVSGVVIEQPELTLAWSSISTDFGGGGGGGGTIFAEIDLNGDSLPPGTALPTPLGPSLIGQRLEGMQGRPVVFIHQYSDGSAEVEVNFLLDPDQTDLLQSSLHLDGPGLAGIEAFHNLPVRIWGIVSEVRNDVPTFEVERVEPVYPGLAVQAWLGRFEPVTLEGKSVLLFTDQEGVQYVLGFSIDEVGDRTSFAPGDPVVVEGIVKPDQSFGGYPVITDYAVNPGQGLADLSGYAAQSVAPVVIQETGTAGAASKATIAAIELAYYTEDLRYADLPAGAPLPFVQPVWRFTGTYENGSPFEILVQALDPRYLSQP